MVQSLCGNPVVQKCPVVLLWYLCGTPVVRVHVSTTEIVLLCGTAVWYFCVVLLCGTAVWYFCVVLLCGTAVWYFCVVLLCGTAV